MASKPLNTSMPMCAFIAVSEEIAAKIVYAGDDAGQADEAAKRYASEVGCRVAVYQPMRVFEQVTRTETVWTARS